MKSAILITHDKESIANESAALAKAADFNVVYTIKKKFLNKPKYGISDLTELKTSCENLNPDVIIFDSILSPRKNYNLAGALGRPVLDRETLILNIFEARANTTENQLQVKLGSLKHEMTIAKERIHFQTLGERPGWGSVGVFSIDKYELDIKKRMKTVKEKLKKVQKHRDLHRRSKNRSQFQTISLAGYTSSGKTTLFNTLTEENKKIDEKLFTTLSTTTRRIEINRKTFLLTDTIGFISKLPPYMIEAFKSTLDELLYTDYIIITVDLSDDEAELINKFRSCTHTLSQLGIENKKLIFALNKSDLLIKEEIDKKIKLLELEDDKNKVIISAKTGANIERLKALIQN